jgi:hypothetical protein
MAGSRSNTAAAVMSWTEVTGRVTDVVPTPAAVTALRPTPWARAPRADHP